MNEKERRLADYCRRGGWDGVLLQRRTNIAWLTDGADVHVDGSSTTGVCSLLWTPRRKTVYCNNVEEPRLRAEELAGAGWRFEVSDWWGEAKAPKGRFATDLPEDRFADLRASLTELELARMRALGAFAADVLEELLGKLVHPGMTEHGLAASIAGSFEQAGMTVPVLLVAADERIARFRHPIPTAREIGKTVMVAICPRQRGLTVALTRLVHFGRRLPSELARRHEAVCRVDAALHAATAPGQRWCDILAVGQQVYRDCGFGAEWKRHHQGGPLGYEGRDFKATPGERRRLVERQALGWNPSIAGTKSEDTMLSSGELITSMKSWPLRLGRPDILLR